MSITVAVNSQEQHVVICTGCLTDLRDDSGEQLRLDVPLDELVLAVVRHTVRCRE